MRNNAEGARGRDGSQPAVFTLNRDELRERTCHGILGRR